MTEYFFDTYAIIEILKGNPNYQHYTEVDYAITQLNLIELHYYMLRTFGEKDAELALVQALKNVANFDESVITAANKFRFKNKSKKLSTADCIGYAYALKNGLIFLTGDREFEGLHGVEFVRA